MLATYKRLLTPNLYTTLSYSFINWQVLKSTDEEADELSESEDEIEKAATVSDASSTEDDISSGVFCFKMLTNLIKLKKK